MTRLAPLRATLCAAAALVLAAAPPALAQWRGGGGGRGEARQDRGWRGGDRPGGERGGGNWRGEGGWRDNGGRGPGRFEGGGFGGRPGPAAGYGGGPGYGGAPRFAGSGANRAWRRGEVLPQGYRGADVADPGRYHLRRAPNGYGWVGDGRNAYLMQRSTGMVLDSVPGAYEPPPPYQGRRRR